MRRTLLFVLVLGIGMRLGYVGLHVPVATASDRQPVQLELDALELGGFEGLEARVDRERDELAATYRARHRTAPGRIVFARAQRALVLVPAGWSPSPPAPVTSSSPAAVTSRG